MLGVGPVPGAGPVPGWMECGVSQEGKRHSRSPQGMGAMWLRCNIFVTLNH